MPDSTVAGIITSVGTSIAVVGGTWVAISTRRAAARRERADEARTAALAAKVDANIAKTDEVHVIVNQQRTNSDNYTAALIRTIVAAGLEIPVDQSLGAISQDPSPVIHDG